MTRGSLFSYLVVGRLQEHLHHVVHVEVFQVWVVPDGRVLAGLVPAEAIWGVVAVGKDACVGHTKQRSHERNGQNETGLNCRGTAESQIESVLQMHFHTFTMAVRQQFYNGCYTTLI